MPELPDVETFRRYANATALHQKINDVDVFEKKVLKGSTASDFKHLLKNQSFDRSCRHGKHLFLETGPHDVVRFHFGMTGFLKYHKNENEIPHVRMRFHFADGYKLDFICQRLFGEVSIEDSVKDFVADHELGPDVLDLSRKDFKNISKQSQKSIKSLLMDQTQMAGLGNIYSDEILFQSRIHPKSKASHLKTEDLESIYRNIKKVMAYAIKHKADPNDFSGSYLLTQRKKGGVCPTCRTKLKQIKVSGRTSYFCPECQKHRK